MASSSGVLLQTSADAVDDDEVDEGVARETVATNADDPGQKKANSS